MKAVVFGRQLAQRPLARGDRVRIVQRVETTCRWNTKGDMDWTLGEVGVIDSVNADTYGVMFEVLGGYEDWYYNFECVRPA